MGNCLPCLAAGQAAARQWIGNFYTFSAQPTSTVLEWEWEWEWAWVLVLALVLALASR